MRGVLQHSVFTPIPYRHMESQLSYDLFVNLKKQHGQQVHLCSECQKEKKSKLYVWVIFTLTISVTNESWKATKIEISINVLLTDTEIVID